MIVRRNFLASGTALSALAFGLSGCFEWASPSEDGVIPPKTLNTFLDVSESPALVTNREAAQKSAAFVRELILNDLDLGDQVRLTWVGDRSVKNFISTRFSIDADNPSDVVADKVAEIIGKLANDPSARQSSTSLLYTLQAAIPDENSDLCVISDGWETADFDKMADVLSGKAALPDPSIRSMSGVQKFTWVGIGLTDSVQLDAAQLANLQAAWSDFAAKAGFKGTIRFLRSL